MVRCVSDGFFEGHVVAYFIVYSGGGGMGEEFWMEWDEIVCLGVSGGCGSVSLRVFGYWGGDLVVEWLVCASG